MASSQQKKTHRKCMIQSANRDPQSCTDIIKDCEEKYRYCNKNYKNCVLEHHCQNQDLKTIRRQCEYLSKGYGGGGGIDYNECIKYFSGWHGDMGKYRDASCSN